MDCAGLHERLDAFLAGTLDAAARGEAARHLAGCAECRDVVALLSGGEVDLGDGEVLRPVQAATSGRSCGRVQEVLASLDPVGADEFGAARRHLDGCPGCARFAAVLDELDEILPTLASRDPGPDFTAGVLLATLPRPPLASVFWRRLRDHLERWQRRRDFAQELSFALTVLLVLVTAIPGSPLQGLPRQALSVVQLGAAEASAADLQEEGTVGAQLRQGLRARGERLGTGFDELGSHVLGAGQGLVDGDLDRVEENAGLIGCDLRRLWVGVKAPAVEPETVCR